MASAHPISMQAIRDADTHFGIVLDGLEAAGLRDETLVVVASDHGYVQITNRISADDLAWVSEIDGAHFDIAGNGCTLLIVSARW